MNASASILTRQTWSDVSLYRLLRRAYVYRPIRFLVIGVVNTAFGYAVFATMLFVTNLPNLSIAVATVCGVAFNYFTTSRFVFYSGAPALFRYIACYAISMLANMTFFSLIFDLSSSKYLSQAIALLPTTLLTYFLLKLFVFKNR